MRFFTLIKMSAFIVLSAFLITSCSNVQETPAGTTTYLDNQGDNSFSFKDDGIKWRVDFEDGDIAAIYRNGEKVPGEDHAKYQDLIYSKISGLNRDMKKFRSDMHTFHFDMEKFREDMKKMKKELHDNLPGKIEIQIDREEFRKGMDLLKESMKELKDKNFKIHIDKELFNEDMKKLKDDLDKIDLDKIKIEVMSNIDDVEKELQKVKINIKDINIDLSGLDEELKDLDIELKKLDSFLTEMKSELVRDGYIKNEDEEFQLALSKDEMLINDQKLPVSLHSKYLMMYEKHFDKKIEGKFRINTR